VVKALFVMTHIGSGWEVLKERLEKSRVQLYSTGCEYHHPEDVRPLLSLPHRRNNATAIWADVILHNKDFTMKRLSEHYRFIFWSCPYEACDVSVSRAYWAYRMDGLRQYFRWCGGLWNPTEKDLKF
jgi:hypothetical protein